MRLPAALAPLTLALVALGVGALAWAAVSDGGEAPEARAFAISYPHGVLVARQRVQISGDVKAVYLGAVRLDAERAVCVSVSADGVGSYRASYRVAGGVVTVTLDARRECSPADPVPYVGGYAEGGGFVGSWSVGAVLFAD